jgi:hypothetical protein
MKRFNHIDDHKNGYFNPTALSIIPVGNINYASVLARLSLTVWHGYGLRPGALQLGVGSLNFLVIKIEIYITSIPSPLCQEKARDIGKGDEEIIANP